MPLLRSAALAIREARQAARRGDEERFSVDTWISDYLLPSGSFGYNGQRYPYGGGGYGGLTQTLAGQRISEIANSLPGYAAALKGCPPAFAAQMVRSLVLSQVRFTFRNLPSTSTPRRTFGTRALAPLERPDTNVTTGELVSRMEWHEGLAGNAYVYHQPQRLRILRPDWVGLVFGSQQEPEDAAYALDGHLLGYVYQSGGLFSGRGRMHTLLPGDVAHWCPLPDPEMAGIGMSWITPALRDIQGDRAAQQHQLMFWENAGTPNLVVKGLPAGTRRQFDEAVEMLEARHTGIANAFRTLYLTAGADATVVGSNFKDMDLKAVVGSGETRIAFLSRVPAPLLGIAEGLAGSSLNAGNFGMARRIFSDGWVHPTLQDLCGALSTIVDVPSGAELWFDTADMPLLREDAKDAAEINQATAATLRQLVDGGFDPAAAVATVAPHWVSTLRHTGKLSVQLQEPGAELAPKSAMPGEGRSYNPAQPRDPHTGEWVDVTPGDTAGKVARTLYEGMHAATDDERKDFRVRVGKAIPPAWTDVHIADDLGTARILARGRDSQGRGQSIYSAEHTEGQAAAKFARVRAINQHLDKLDHALRRDSETNDHAAALLLIRRLGMRPGSERDTGAKAKAHGATNLRARHVTVSGDQVDFDFIGKKGVHIQLSVADADIARAVSARLASRSGDMPLFDTDENRTRDYLHSTGVPPEFLLKDLRTVHANVVALREISARGGRVPESKMEFRKWRREVAEAVSAELGNTPTLALASYINPTVFAPWVKSEDWL